MKSIVSNIEELTRHLDRRLVDPLPGSQAHEMMRATPVGTSIPEFNHALPPKPGSVVILLFEEDGVIKFPLIKRPRYVGAHSGQVSLPGGKQEENEDAVATALREANEEIGVPSWDIRVIGKLSNFFVIPSNFLVTPVIASIEQPVFIPDAREVDNIFFCSLEKLLDESSVLTKEIVAAERFRMLAPHFEIQGEVVWGATAMILNEFRFILRDIIQRY